MQLVVQADQTLVSWLNRAVHRLVGALHPNGSFSSAHWLGVLRGAARIEISFVFGIPSSRRSSGSTVCSSSWQTLLIRSRSSS